MELKDKLKTEEITKTDKAPTIEMKQKVQEDDRVSEAISALQVLGYSRKEIETAMEKIDVTSLTVEDIIRKGLVLLSRD